jgi:hypothetical protein
MPAQEGIEVANRFFEAIDKLIELKQLNGKQTFCTRYDIDKRNFYLIKKKVDQHNLNVAWLTYLVRDYGVSAKWLLLGKGKMI